MKNYIISLFDGAHLWWTILYIVTAVLLLILSQVIGNAASLFLLFPGLILLFYTFIHPFRELESFVKFSVTCGGIMGLNFILYLIMDKFDYHPDIYETIVLTINLFIGFPGLSAGLIGGIILAIKKKRA
jgi:hypothetical protein